MTRRTLRPAIWVAVLTLVVLAGLGGYLVGRTTASPDVAAPLARKITNTPAAVPSLTAASLSASPSPTTSAVALRTVTSAPTAPPVTATATSSSSPTSPPSTATLPPAISPTTDPAEALEQEMIAVMNELRRASGCGVALRRSPELTLAARKHSRDMAVNQFFDHRGSDGSTRITRAEAAGYVGAPDTRVRENIGVGPVPADVVAYWMNLDEIHRSQILDCAYTDVGAGYALGDGTPYTHYWTVNFGVGVR